jgi:hypothetical protein
MKHFEENKQCPFFQKNCLKEKCKLYHEQFDRCEIGLLSYNLFKLKEVLESK